MQRPNFDRRQLVRLAALAVILIGLVAFVLDNSHSVRVGFILGDREARLIWVLIVTALLGGIADRLLLWRRRP